MAYSIDLTAALKVNKQDNRSKAADFPNSSADKTYNFRDSLKEAVRGKNQDERKPESDTALRKELVSRSETKLKSLKKPEQNSEEKDKAVEDGSEEQTDKIKKTMDEMLAKLEELSKLQQLGEVPAEKQTVLLEGIKEALKELTAMQGSSTGIESAELQLKTSELAAKLVEMQEVLKSNVSLMNNAAALDFDNELKSVIEEATVKLEAGTKVPVENNKAEFHTVKENNNTDEATANLIETDDGADNTIIAHKQLKEAVPDVESKLSSEATENQEQVIKIEAPVVDTKPVIKETQPEAEETTDEVKAALESKVEKVTVEGKETKKQDADAEEGKETAHQAPKVINATQHKQVNEEMIAIKLDQMAVDNQVEVVQNPVPTAKSETVNKGEIINQIVKKAEVIFTDAKQEIRMQLEPENLGKLNLKLAVEKGLITAKFVAESYEVKQVIESHFNELKDMLQEKGLEVQNFSVSVGQDSKEFNNGNAFQQWKETVKLNGRNLNRGSYDGYQAGEAAPVRTVNPYSIHNGKFDHRA